MDKKKHKKITWTFIHKQRDTMSDKKKIHKHQYMDNFT